MKMLAILLFSLVPSLLANVDCGVRLPQNFTDAPSRFERAIIGGEKVGVDSWPWQVLVVSREETDDKRLTSKCGGTVLTREWILTAAHCLKPLFTNVDVIKSTREVFVGVNQSESLDQSAAKNVIQVIRHPNYTKKHEDIALLKLDSPLIFDHTVSPVCLPNLAQSIPHDGIAVTTGYENASTMRKLTESNGTYTLEVDGNLSAHIHEDTEFSMLGDSGGPLMMKSTDGRWFQIGITAFGSEPYPSMFTDVRKYCEWMEKATEGEVKCAEKEVILQEKIDE